MTRGRLEAFRDLRRETAQLKQLVDMELCTEGMKTAYQKKVETVEREALAIEKAIDALPPIERAVMRSYYIEGHTLESVAMEIRYSKSQVKRYKKNALEKLNPPTRHR